MSRAFACVDCGINLEPEGGRSVRCSACKVAARRARRNNIEYSFSTQNRERMRVAATHREGLLLATSVSPSEMAALRENLRLAGSVSPLVHFVALRMALSA